METNVMKAGTPMMLPVLLLIGCRADVTPPPGGSKAPPPAHPAMKEAATGQPAAPPAGHGAEGLPAGHPPIPGGGPTSAPPGAGAAAPAPPAGEGADLAAKLKLLGLSLKVPEGWVEDPVQRPMRLATIRLPRKAADAEDGELSVSQARGGLEANVERWRGQFQERPEPVLAKRENAGVEVTTVEMEGTFADSMRGGGPKPGTKLLGAIVRTPGADTLVFFKAWGPRATMEAWKPSFEEFVASIQPAR
jgi:hypothetical protein